MVSSAEPSSEMERLVIFTDGGARGNPGPAGIGIVFYCEDEFGNRKELKKIKKYIGKQTNNFAEYSALITGLTEAQSMRTEAGHDFKSLHCYLDSELVVKQVNGLYKVREETLKPLVNEVQTLAKIFTGITFTHVHREKNVEADKLVNEILDEQEKRGN